MGRVSFSAGEGHVAKNKGVINVLNRPLHRKSTVAIPYCPLTPGGRLRVVAQALLLFRNSWPRSAALRPQIAGGGLGGKVVAAQKAIGDARASPPSQISTIPNISKGPLHA